MKFNKWTLGLAAVGVVSLASAAKAEEKNALQTALSATTISGYVDTSAQWNIGTGTDQSYYKFGKNKADGFNLNVVQLSISKPLDESEWAAGYKADLWFGPDANQLGTTSASANGSSSDFGIRQAYVALRAPLGNGLDFKMGVFDTIIGYESIEAGNNPNFTRSYGHSIEPQTSTGLLTTYRFCDMFSASAGVANTIDSQINGRTTKAESFKAYMGSIALTAPQDWGWVAGSTLYAGVVNGVSSGVSDPVNTSYYVGATLATPVTGLKFGAAYDYRDADDSQDDFANRQDMWAVALYASFQATEKLSLHARGELFDVQQNAPTSDNQIWEFTGTIQYDLWQNVMSRLEVRWDHGDEGHYFSGSSGPDTQRNSVLIAANVIYKF